MMFSSRGPSAGERRGETGGAAGSGVPLNEASLWIGRVFGIVGLMLFPLWVGTWFDRRFEMAPVGVLMGIVLGLTLAIVSLVTWSRTFGKVPRGRHWQSVEEGTAGEPTPGSDDGGEK